MFIQAILLLPRLDEPSILLPIKSIPRTRIDWDSHAHYSLVVTIKTPDVGVDIYTPVANVVLV